MDELFKAMQMFKQGVQDLQFSRSLNEANEAVRQIKSSEMNEQQKYNALNDLGRQFALTSMNLGRSASETQLAMGVFTPKIPTLEQQFALAGDDVAAQKEILKKMEQVDVTKSAGERLVAQAGLPIKLANQGRADAGLALKAQEVANKRLNVGEASSRSPLGKWADTIDRGSRLKALFGDPERMSQLTETDFELATGGLVQMVEGKAITESEKKALSIFNRKVAKARVAFMATGVPQPLDMGDQAKMLMNIVDREDENAKKQMTKMLLNNASSIPEAESILGQKYIKDRLVDSLNTYARLDLTADDVIYDEKSGSYTIKGEKTSQPKQKLSEDDKAALKWAQSNRKDPRAQKILKSFEGK